MLGEIDVTLKPQETRLFLCKPDRETIAELNEAYDIRLVANYGGIDELSFNLPFKILKNKRTERNKNIDLLRGHYLIRYEKGNTKEYFVISKPKNNSQDGKEIKEIQCYLQPYELRDKIVRSYKGIKLLSEVLTDTLLAKTDWTINYIDGDVAIKYREFDVSEKNLLDFMNELANTFDAVIVWDTVNKEINFYKNENLGLDKHLVIEHGRYLKSIEEEPDFDNVATRLYVYGKDGISITKENSSGTEYIESFDYYMYPFQRDISRVVLKHSNYMSDDLCHAILDYNDLLITKDGEFSTLLSQKTTHQTTLTTKQNEIDALNTEKILIEDIYDIQQATRTINIYDFTYNGATTTKTATLDNANKYVALCKVSSITNLTVKLDTVTKTLTANTWTVLGKIGSATSTSVEFSGIGTSINVDLVVIKITDIEHSTAGNESTLIDTYSLGNKIDQINAKQTEIDQVNSDISGVDSQIATLRNDIDVNNPSNFTAQQITERNKFIQESIWTDGNYYDSNELYQDAKNELIKLSQPLIQYTIDIVDFLKVLRSQRDWGKLNKGDIVTIKYSNFNIDIKAKIIQIDHDEDSNSITLTIANGKDIDNGFLTLKDLVNRSVSTSSTVNMNKVTWNKSEGNESQINSIINDKWDATKREIQAGVNESVDISRKGLIIKDPTDPLRYLVGQHGIIALTNDGGNTWKHAITPDGILGERIFGKILAGVNLQIDASDSGGTTTFTVDSNGVTLNGASLTITGGLPSSELIKDGLVELDTDYANGIRIDTTNGLVVTRSDDRVKSTLNATDGIKIEYDTTGANNWIDVFKVNIDGSLVAESLTANKLIVKNGGDVLINADTKTIDFSKFNTIVGNITATNIDATNLQVTSANVTGTLTSNQIDIKGTTISDGGQTTFSVDGSGNVTLAGNITMTGGSITWASVSKPSYIANEVSARADTWIPDYGTQVGGTKPPTDADNTYGELNSNSNIKGFYYNSSTGKLELNADFITTGELRSDKLMHTTGASNSYATISGTYADLQLLYLGSEYFKIYNGIDHLDLKGFSTTFLRYSSASSSTLLLGTWDFSSATVTGLDMTAKFG